MRSGIVIGYDPGGNGCNGVAELEVVDGRAVRLTTYTKDTVEDVIAVLESKPPLIALGVDTLTCWSTGKSSWRPADRWLRKRYEPVQKSIASPNSLFGAMGLNGMAMLIEARRMYPDIPITETHPKVLYHHLTGGQKYDYVKDRMGMDAALATWLGVSIIVDSEHAWDAAISAYAALEGLMGRWTHDLHDAHWHSAEKGERIIHPCKPTNYFWPELRS